MIAARRGHDCVRFRRYSSTVGINISIMPLNVSGRLRALYKRSTRTLKVNSPRLGLGGLFELRGTLVAFFLLPCRLFLFEVYLTGGDGGDRFLLQHGSEARGT